MALSDPCSRQPPQDVEALLLAHPYETPFDTSAI